MGGFSSVGVSANCKVGFDQCIRVFVFVFLFSLCKKKRDSACVCVLIKELLLMFAEVIFFEWVCSGDDFFLMGFF